MSADSTATPSPVRNRICVITGDHSVVDETKPGGHYNAGDLRYDRTMRQALSGLSGYEFEFINDHSEIVDRFRNDPPSFVLNFCDTGLYNVATRELHLAALLESFDIPYSGAPPACMAICYDKSIVRLVADSLGIATPAERLIEADAPLGVTERFCYPALIKPNAADGSIGITRDSMVANAEQAAVYLETLRGQLPGRAALLQEYLPGPEYGLALIGNPANGFRRLPPLRVDFSDLPPELPPILSYESKTDPDSPYWNRVRLVPAALDDATFADLAADAERLFSRLQCRDYARFDFRADNNGVIKLMEVNPNPAWDCEAKLAVMAGFAGMSYSELLELLLKTALGRLGSE